MSTAQNEPDPGPDEPELEFDQDASEEYDGAHKSEEESESGTRTPRVAVSRPQPPSLADSSSAVGDSSPDARPARRPIAEDEEDESSVDALVESGRRPVSKDWSVSTPDDSPSVQSSVPSSPVRRRSIQSPNTTLKPFDRRFKARLSYPSQRDSRSLSPAFLASHSRQSSLASLAGPPSSAGTDTPDAPWEVVRWTKLRKLSGEVFSETGKRSYGRPTCFAVASVIAIGTSKGMVLVFDYHQNLKATMGLGTKAVESGKVTAIALSADHSTVAAGHADGSVYTWEIAKPAKPFLQIPSTPIGQIHESRRDGHVKDVKVLHVGFLGTRHTAVVSADDKGMAFSHLATRGMGPIGRTVRTTRILGRYPEVNPIPPRPKKPSAVLAFSPLPLGQIEAVTDSMGLVAMLTPYLLVVVSTTPVAQTQHKASRPKELAAHGAMSAALAWYPSMKQSSEGENTVKTNAKLAYCWVNVVTVLEVSEVESSESEREAPPELDFQFKRRWKAEESIVAMQWINRTVLALVTISQRLLILEDTSATITDSSDLMRRQMYHIDFHSEHLSHVIENLDDDNTQMHGVVADAFYMSLKAYKGRLFLFGFNDISIGTLSNWADRLLALMEQGDFIAAIRLATSYYIEDSDKASIGLPEDLSQRQQLVHEKLTEIMTASLKYAFGKNPEATTTRVSNEELEKLAASCFAACLAAKDTDFLFEEVFPWYAENEMQESYLELLEANITNGNISFVPPVILKNLVNELMAGDKKELLEETICRLSPETMDLDQLTSLCREYNLYDALFYVWNEAIGDYTTVLKELLDKDPDSEGLDVTRVFTYLSYILTSRVYPTGDFMNDEQADRAKSEIYFLLFSGATEGKGFSAGSFVYLKRLLDLDAASFMSMLNEAFEDSFLNGSADLENGTEAPHGAANERRFRLSLNRQYILRILLQIFVQPQYTRDDTIYLDMFIARSMPKYPQYIQLRGSILEKVFDELCDYPNEEVAEDCELSVEYLLSVYQPPDLLSLIPKLTDAGFYRVIKSIYKQERQYAPLLRVCFEDDEHPETIFETIRDCLRPNSGLSKKELQEFRSVMEENMSRLAAAGLSDAAITLETYAPELHEDLVSSLKDDEHAQYQYLKELFEPSDDREPSQSLRAHHAIVELYVRLLCDYDPHHVSQYIESLKTGELRLDEVLPALESSGVVDAAVILMARHGRVRKGIDRLMQHLKTLESALLGLLEQAHEAPDEANARENADGLIDSLEKYTLVGIYLCRMHQNNQHVTNGTGSPFSKNRKRMSRLSMQRDKEEDLQPHELLWLDLIDTVVLVTQNVSEALSPDGNGLLSPPASAKQVAISPTTVEPKRSASSAHLLDRLRSIVQTSFTALLNSTTATSIAPTAPSTSTATSLPASVTLTHAAPQPPAPTASQSFIPILRTFLRRASARSPSLSHLRSVLASVFAAYAYEEGLLALANRMLDKDLFVAVAEVDRRRRRGWRPLGMACGGCGVRVWGPGAGVGVWEGWVKERERAGKEERSRDKVDDNGKGKGKAVETAPEHEADTKDGNALLVFSCRHVFHRKCLEEVKAGETEDGDRPARPRYRCPLEIDEDEEREDGKRAARRM